MKKTIKVTTVFLFLITLLSCSNNSIFKIQKIDKNEIEITGYKNQKHINDEITIVPERIGSKIVTAISERAFLHGKTISLPKTIKKIGEYGIVTPNNNQIYYDGTVADYCKIEVDSYLFQHGGQLYFLDEENGQIEFNNKHYDEVRNMVIPDEITKLSSYLFAKLSNLESVTIGSGITKIPHDAFWHTDVNFKTIYIGENTIEIGNDAFYGCQSLETILMNDKLEIIGDRALHACQLLKNTILPKSLKYIGAKALPPAVDFYYSGSEEEWNNIEKGEEAIRTTTTIYFYSENEPTISGNYWHYDSNNNIIVW